VRWVGLLVMAAAVGLGLAAEAAAFRWDEPGRWLPDLTVGLTFVACGLLAFRPARAAATLLAATGAAWFLGTVSSDLLYLHRGPLVHLLVAYPGWRPRSRLDLAAVAAGYVAAIVTPVWQSEAATIAGAAVLAAVAARGYLTAPAPARRDRRTALQAVAALAAVLAAGAIALVTVPNRDAVEPVLHVYEATLVAIAVGLCVRLRRPSVVADLVVELGESRSGTLRDRLARALGDPTLAVGYWSAEDGAYVGATGARLTIPADRAATHVERDGAPFAVLVHDAAVLRDPQLVAAVASATRLSASNVALRAEVRAQAEELSASRRRLLAAADDERRRLELRLREGPQRRLDALAPALEGDERLARARLQLARTLDDLQELGRGLHPRELTEAGLAAALAALAERAPVPVAVDVRVGRLPAAVEATVYYVCAEALANVAKYAQAATARLEVTADDGRVRLLVADDGVGGADPARGTGLQGLADRVAALGGTLAIASPLGSGTRLTAEVPLGGEAR
jgi:hypothetical protein